VLPLNVLQKNGPITSTVSVNTRAISLSSQTKAPLIVERLIVAEHGQSLAQKLREKHFLSVVGGKSLPFQFH
jgi:hypothetical protein